MSAIDLRRPLRPVPSASLRPWAGARLGPGGIGELWLAGPDSLVPGPDGDQATLEQLAGRHGPALVGERGMALLGRRFPLLVKLIDAAAWLSLQVHPSDAVAADLCGPRCLGKTEAWVVVEAEPGAELITGPNPARSERDLRSAIDAGTLDRPGCQVTTGRAGDAWLIRAGTMHAIGPGLLVYEIEQPSDLTYRISDWGRPVTPDRPLHRREALRSLDAGAHAVPVGTGFRLDSGALSVPELRLEIVTGRPGGADPSRTPDGHSLEIVTALGGRVTVAGDGWQEVIEVNETVVVPAAVAGYALTVETPAMAFVGSIP
jgi:mannose-6-phosphate isomerase